MAAETPVLLQVEDLQVGFDTDEGRVHAVDTVSFDVHEGEILGVVGESGSGKSVTMMSLMGLVGMQSGAISGRFRFSGRELHPESTRQMRKIRGNQIGMVFQDPMTALNPVLKVGSQIAEAVRIHQRVSRRAAWQRAVELLTTVGVPQPDQRAEQYPHQYSGGMRQRAMIAMAIANDPLLLIADEPTTALDVTIQAQVLDLLRKAQQETGAATIFITHDLGVIAELAERVIVMYAGRIAERGSVASIFGRPRHPYTVGLLGSLPSLAQDNATLTPIPGSPPNLLEPATGCPFEPRCVVGRGRAVCAEVRPQLVQIAPGHESACHFADELQIIDGVPYAGPGPEETAADNLTSGTGREQEATKPEETKPEETKPEETKPEAKQGQGDE